MYVVLFMLYPAIYFIFELVQILQDDF